MTSVIVKCIEVNEQDLNIVYAIDALTSSSYTYLMAPDQIGNTYIHIPMEFPIYYYVVLLFTCIK